MEDSACNKVNVPAARYWRRQSVAGVLGSIEGSTEAGAGPGVQSTDRTSCCKHCISRRCKCCLVSRPSRRSRYSFLLVFQIAHLYDSNLLYCPHILLDCSFQGVNLSASTCYVMVCCTMGTPDREDRGQNVISDCHHESFLHTA